MKRPTPYRLNIERIYSSRLKLKMILEARIDFTIPLKEFKRKVCRSAKQRSMKNEIVS
jgi:hypothetical protein